MLSTSLTPDGTLTSTVPEPLGTVTEIWVSLSTFTERVEGNRIFFLHSGQGDLAVADLRTGAIATHHEFCTEVEEIFDVQVLPGIVSPCISGPCVEANAKGLISGACSRKSPFERGAVSRSITRHYVPDCRRESVLEPLRRLVGKTINLLGW